MLATTTALFVLSAAAVRAVVVPSEPGPGSVYKEGGKCHIAWTGDKSSTTNWKDMTIKLRTGSNTDMKDITVIATGQDGTADGVYDYDCPDVTPQSAIYFYEFTAPAAAADGAQWTTRFTIADSAGNTTPPSETTQPDGATIAWGTGQLQSGEASGSLSSGGVMSGTAASASASVSASGSASDASSAESVTTSTVAAATTSGMTSVRTAGATSAASSAARTGGAAVASASASGSPNGAIAVSSSSFTPLIAFLGTTAMAFTLLL